ncbi:MAG: acyl-coenzyme A thioesterase PaaI-like protein [Cycloclasticus pugetii]|jgi:acyl-coenzyme A thioesterase PaaI-like protein|uniref:Thioesterase family protein n=2 Tax=Cycloclasticus TaxID=34067 RepID=S5TW17_9GAMM|nr:MULTISPECIES: PaaI family thioesterase [Cycloclasticus]AFT67504.1 Thioesterase superfamily protein [Cycloclasticus sp. P1]AGS39330.1 Thioesterase family protein [Cycloclasticus zancles 78-ME]ATI02935.1 PaaI family thioesterase [Cycloclasticus sp. PY97N]EPD13688.1 Thioesterase superfamily protein [Cycloclasticus pugetii]MBV1898007.1 PaaI family thioesterase [Cycloclasticus sp.]|tara:strand:+ start:1735 stop:2181 length:447 start_codon:yes stop_codon:yes gene_type:complete
MSLVEKINDIKLRHDYEAIVELIPYAKTIGVETSMVGESIVSSLRFMESNIGNPAVPALHGGVIAGFMENSALLHLIWEIELVNIPKIIDVSIDYLRPGQTTTTYSKCDIVRLGSRVALCNIIAWQEDINKPIAQARGHFLLSENRPL